MFLSEQELVDLTHRVKPAWQARALELMGISFRKRPDGTLVVLRSSLEQKQDARPRPQLRVG
jgi:hypothetical protein